MRIDSTPESKNLQDSAEPDGSVRRIQRAETLGPVSKITRQQARAFLQDKAATINLSQRRPRAFISLEEFVRAEWRPNAALALKKSTVKYYGFQLDRHIIPALCNCSLYEISRAQIEAVLSDLRQKGHASGTLRGVRATFSTVLQSAIERGYLDKNPAHGIRIRHDGISDRAPLLFPGSGTPALARANGAVSHSRSTCRSHRVANRRSPRPPLETCE